MKRTRVALSVLVTALTLLSGTGLSQQSGSADEPTLKQATLPAVELTYQDQGQGDAVVFVHGLFADHRIWEGQREAVVAQGYRFIALDLRYHGKGPWPEDETAAALNYALPTFESDLAALIQELGVGPAHVVGHSSSGHILVNFALHYPQLVRSLILYEPATSAVVTDPKDRETMVKIEEGIGPAYVASQEENDQRKSVRLFAEWVNGQPGSFDNLPPAVRTIFLDNSRTLKLAFAGPLFAFEASCAQVGQIQVPVTIMKGQQTPRNWEIVADTLHSCIPDSQLVTLPNARHLGPVENTTGFNETLLSHLEGVGTEE